MVSLPHLVLVRIMAGLLQERIDAAIARIEAASARRARATDADAARHAALRARMTEAIAALDDVIARGAAG